MFCVICQILDIIGPMREGITIRWRKLHNEKFVLFA